MAENTQNDVDAEVPRILAVNISCAVGQLADYGKDLWYAIELDLDHDIFTKDVAPSPSFLEIPVVVHRVGTFLV
ncbi:hypothetical protein QC762_0077750 [Podospora pseudocomata]|uniref:Uncharacterized protein n=1 Tax=Podospora pseudocomata TaxID=2093779 RepID=A0ABR0GAT7_9PEZI|nr:hypothetical protein QC762_0077750 [Podospora pseudocomata]